MCPFFSSPCGELGNLGSSARARPTMPLLPDCKYIYFSIYLSFVFFLSIRIYNVSKMCILIILHVASLLLLYYNFTTTLLLLLLCTRQMLCGSFRSSFLLPPSFTSLTSLDQHPLEISTLSPLLLCTTYHTRRLEPHTLNPAL